MSRYESLNLTADMVKLSFLKERKEAKAAAETPYTVMVVDDDEVVHQVTSIVLRDLEFENHRVELVHMYSMLAAKEYFMETNKHVAVVLLDVVMETDDAGLQLVKYIRQELKNNITRIVLRTGQPGIAPEERIMVDYDINDYRLKTELSATTLTSTVLGCLRNFRDINQIKHFKDGLEKVIQSTSTLYSYECQSLPEFLGDILKQIVHFSHSANTLVLRKQHTDEADANPGRGTYEVLAASGEYQKYRDADFGQIQRELMLELKDAVNIDQTQILTDTGNDRIKRYYLGQHTPMLRNHEESYLYIIGGDISDINENYINLFLRNISLSLDNYLMKQDTDDALSEILMRTASIVEARDGETGNHVMRVSAISGLIASKVGIGKMDLRDFRLASMMHDVGKIGVKDSVLLKPGKLTGEEFEHIKTHSAIGGKLFENSAHKMIKMAGDIARYHHERWDGSGYPSGLSGADIPLYARITSIADVYDALTNDRVYRKAWPTVKARDYIAQQSGLMFDPELVKVFQRNYSQIQKICSQYNSGSSGN